MSSGPLSFRDAVSELRSTVNSLRRAGADLPPRVTAAVRRIGLLPAPDPPAMPTAQPTDPESSPATEPATEADIVAAYRLLLGREPDPTGLAGYRRRRAAGALRRDELATELLGSPEFARRHPHLGAAGTVTEDVDVEGFVITIDPADWAVGATIAAVRRYEPEVTAKVRSLIRPGGTFVDVGANIGWFSLLAASIVGNTGSVLAIEPNLRNCELLAASAARNRFAQIDVVAGAASDNEGWLALETDASNGRVITLGPVSGRTAPVRCSYAVPSFTLDGLLAGRRLGEVDAVKVDVEGVETQVFAGAERLLAERHPPIVFEWFPLALRSTGEVDPTAPLRLLRHHGYAISVIGHSSADTEPSGPGLSDDEVEAVRVGSGRENLDLLARRRP